MVRLDSISFNACPDMSPPLVYHNPDSPAEVQHARELHERIRRNRASYTRHVRGEYSHTNGDRGPLRIPDGLARTSLVGI